MIEHQDRMSSRWTRSRRLAVGLVLGVIGSLGYSTCVTAQDIVRVQGDGDPKLSEALTSAIQKRNNDLYTQVVRINPALVTVDPQTHTATLEFENPSDDTLDATIADGVIPPQPPHVIKSQQQTVLPDILIADSSSSSSAAENSSANTIRSDMSLVSWIQGLPSHIVLAPHEKKAVTVHLNVPSNVKNGEYTAWIVTSTKAYYKSVHFADGDMDVDIPQDTDKVKRPDAELQSGAKLVFTVGK